MGESNIWLARVRMNPRSREVRRDLRNVGELHRTVMSMFPDMPHAEAREALGVLHRLEAIDDRPVLLVQAGAEPDLTNLPEEYGIADRTPLLPLFDRLTLGRGVRYRIVANATKRPKAGPMAGKRVALGADDARVWWKERAFGAGLGLLDDPTMTAETFLGASSDKDRLTLRGWRIDGVASVVDADKLIAAVSTGIGRGRAYGCGMLSLALLAKAQM